MRGGGWREGEEGESAAVAVRGRGVACAGEKLSATPGAFQCASPCVSATPKGMFHVRTCPTGVSTTQACEACAVLPVAEGSL